MNTFSMEMAFVLSGLIQQNKRMAEAIREVEAIGWGDNSPENSISNFEHGVDSGWAIGRSVGLNEATGADLFYRSQGPLEEIGVQGAAEAIELYSWIGENISLAQKDPEEFFYQYREVIYNRTELLQSIKLQLSSISEEVEIKEDVLASLEESISNFLDEQTGDKHDG